MLPRYDWSEGLHEAEMVRIREQLDAMNESNRLHRIYNQIGKCPKCSSPVKHEDCYFCTTVHCTKRGCGWASGDM